MTEQHRPVHRSRNAIDEVGVTDARRLDADEDLVLARIVDVDVGADERILGRI